jgi:plasmid stabilization system protein ParE
LNVRFSIEARAQILEAKAYFLKQKRERAAEFVREVRRISTLIGEFPELGVSRGRLRLALLQGFTYALLYEVRIDGIYVSDVIHRGTERYARFADFREGGEP